MAPVSALPSCQLFDLVLDMKWDRVILHVQKHPEDARYQDGDCYETPLYLASQLGPRADAVVALATAFSQATTIKSKNGDVPLHIACHYGANSDVLQVLVDANPATTLLQTKYGKTAVGALCDGFQEDNEQKWQKIEIILQGVARAQDFVNKDKEVLMVHAAVSLGCLGCPSKVLDWIVDKFPAQVYQQCASCGRLPLHLAIRSTEWSWKRRYKPREQYCIEKLLTLYPQAARVRQSDGRLPLHTAVSNGHSWHGGVKNLFHAHPRAGTIVDQDTKLLPFQLAAIPVGESQASLDTIFELLLAQPHLLHQYTTSIKETIPKQPDNHGYISLLTVVTTYVAALSLAAIVWFGNNAVIRKKAC